MTPLSWEVDVDYSEEHIAIEWAKAEKISMKRVPGVVPPTPTDLAPGVEYLTDSPFGGTKSITQLPPNPSDGSSPDALRFTVPLRKIGGEIFFPPGSGEDDGTIVQPTRTLTYEAMLSNIDTYEDFDSSLGWPVHDIANNSYRCAPVSLEDVLSLKMMTPMVLIYAYNSHYHGYCETFMTGTPEDIDMVKSAYRVEFKFNFLPNREFKPYIGNADPEYPTLWQAAFATYLLYTDGNWNDRLTVYDRRSQFNAAVEAAEHPFFAYLKRCKESNASLAKVLALLSSLDVACGDDVGGGMVFLYDTRLYVPPVTPTATHPIVLYEKPNFQGKYFAVPFGMGSRLHTPISALTGGVLSSARSVLFGRVTWAGAVGLEAFFLERSLPDFGMVAPPYAEYSSDNGWFSRGMWGSNSDSMGDFGFDATYILIDGDY